MAIAPITVTVEATDAIRTTGNLIALFNKLERKVKALNAVKLLSSSESVAGVNRITKSFDALLKKVGNVQTAINKLDTTVTGTGKVFDDGTKSVEKHKKSFISLIPHVAAVTASYMAMRTALRFAREMVATSVTFEHSMSIVAGVSDATQSEFEELSAAARKAGTSTIWTAKEAAEALRMLSLAGLSASDSIKALPGVLDLATVGQLDLERATEITVDTMNAMKLCVTDLARINNVYALVANVTTTDVEQLSEGMKYAAGIAGNLGYSLEEVVSMLGIMAQSSVKGGQAGRSLQQALVKTSKIARQLGMDVKSNLIDVLKQLEKRQIRPEKIANMFGLVAVKGVVALKNHIAEYEKLKNKTDNVGDEVGRLISRYNDLYTALRKLGSMITEVSIAIMDKYKDSLRKSVVETRDWLFKNKDAIVSFIGILGQLLKELAKFLEIYAVIILFNEFMTVIKLVGLELGITKVATEALTESINIAKLALIGFMKGFLIVLSIYTTIEAVKALHAAFKKLAEDKIIQDAGKNAQNVLTNLTKDPEKFIYQTRTNQFEKGSIDQYLKALSARKELIDKEIKLMKASGEAFLYDENLQDNIDTLESLSDTIDKLIKKTKELTKISKEGTNVRGSKATSLGYLNTDMTAEEHKFLNDWVLLGENAVDELNRYARDHLTKFSIGNPEKAEKYINKWVANASKLLSKAQGTIKSGEGMGINKELSILKRNYDTVKSVFTKNHTVLNALQSNYERDRLSIIEKYLSKETELLDKTFGVHYSKYVEFHKKLIKLKAAQMSLTGVYSKDDISKFMAVEMAKIDQEINPLLNKKMAGWEDWAGEDVSKDLKEALDKNLDIYKSALDKIGVLNDTAFNEQLKLIEETVGQTRRALEELRSAIGITDEESEKILLDLEKSMRSELFSKWAEELKKNVTNTHPILSSSAEDTRESTQNVQDFIDLWKNAFRIILEEGEDCWESLFKALKSHAVNIAVKSLDEFFKKPKTSMTDGSSYVEDMEPDIAGFNAGSPPRFNPQIKEQMDQTDKLIAGLSILSLVISAFSDEVSAQSSRTQGAVSGAIIGATIGKGYGAAIGAFIGFVMGDLSYSSSKRKQRKQAKETFEGITRSLNRMIDPGTNLEEKLKDISEQFRIWGKELHELGMHDDTVNDFMKREQELVDQTLKEAAEDRAEIFTELNRSVDVLTGKASSLTQEMWAVNDQFDDFRQSLEDAGASVGELAILEQKRLEAIEATLKNFWLAIDKQFEESNKYARWLQYQYKTGGSYSSFMMKEIKELDVGAMSFDEFKDIAGMINEWFSAAVQERIDKANKEKETADRWKKAADAVKQLIEMIENTIRSIKYSALNVALPSERLTEATSDYSKLKSIAFGPDATSEDINKFVNFTQTYLQEAQNRWKSSETYQKIYADVMKDLLDLQNWVKEENFLKKIYEQLVSEEETIKVNVADIVKKFDSLQNWYKNILKGKMKEEDKKRAAEFDWTIIFRTSRVSGFLAELLKKYGAGEKFVMDFMMNMVAHFEGIGDTSWADLQTLFESLGLSADIIKKLRIEYDAQANMPDTLEDLLKMLNKIGIGPDSDKYEELTKSLKLQFESADGLTLSELEEILKGLNFDDEVLKKLKLELGLDDSDLTNLLKGGINASQDLKDLLAKGLGPDLAAWQEVIDAIKNAMNRPTSATAALEGGLKADPILEGHFTEGLKPSLILNTHLDTGLKADIPFQTHLDTGLKADIPLQTNLDEGLKMSGGLGGALLEGLNPSAALATLLAAGLNVNVSLPKLDNYTSSGAFPAMASGGDVFANKPVWVGEVGPELFIPRTAGNIVSNDTLGRPTTVNVYIDGEKLSTGELMVAADEYRVKVNRRKVSNQRIYH